MPDPNEYQCLCRITACATCTGTDQKHIHNQLPWRQNYPGVLGHESVGVVIKTGTKVRYIKEGEVYLRPTAVYPGEKLGDYFSMWGGFAEYGLLTDVRALKEDRPDATPNGYCRFQQKLPPNAPISPADATALITLKETASYVASAGVKLCSSLALLGAGSVAICMCRFAKIFGAYPVIMAARRDEQLAYARERIGADFTVNVTSENLAARVKEITAGNGVDFLIDTTGDAEFLRDALVVLSPTGKVAAYATYKNSEIVKKLIPAERLVGAATGEDIAHQYMLDAVRMGLVKLSDFYSHRLPLSKIKEGFDMLQKKTAFKVVFEMEGKQ